MANARDVDGASLIYTTSDEASDLPSLIHASLDVESSRGRWELPKASVIERDKILVPPNWDSAGKIRVLRDGSDSELEEVSQRWSEDIHRGLEINQTISPPPPLSPNDPDFGAESDPTDSSAVAMYEDKVPYSSSEMFSRTKDRTPGDLEVTGVDIQDFLRTQLTVLESLRRKANARSHRKPDAENTTTTDAWGRTGPRGQDLGVSHHIGPVKCNVGGIQVDIDADDAVRRLNVSRYSLRITICY